MATRILVEDVRPENCKEDFAEYVLIKLARPTRVIGGLGSAVQNGWRGDTLSLDGGITRSPIENINPVRFIMSGGIESIAVDLIDGDAVVGMVERAARAFFDHGYNHPACIEVATESWEFTEKNWPALIEECRRVARLILESALT